MAVSLTDAEKYLRLAAEPESSERPRALYELGCLLHRAQKVTVCRLVKADISERAQFSRLFGFEMQCFSGG
jgi:hypothetical protein